MLTLIDEHTRECLAINLARILKSEDVLERLSDLFVRRGVPAYIRSDNGAEFTATKVREWLGVKTLFIERWRRHFNAVRPHSSLGYRAPAPEAIQPASATPQQAKQAGVGATPALT